MKMKIQILGAGCSKCKTLMRNAEAAIKLAGVDAEISKVDQLNDIMEFGVILTPALVIDGKVKSVGKVLSVPEIQKMIS